MHPNTGRRRVLIDLYCCAGAATKGYQDAGFYVSEADVEDILVRRACGQKLAYIGAIYGLSESGVSGICTGEVWTR